MSQQHAYPTVLPASERFNLDTEGSVIPEDALPDWSPPTQVDESPQGPPAYSTVEFTVSSNLPTYEDALRDSEYASRHATPLTLQRLPIESVRTRWISHSSAPLVMLDEEGAFCLASNLHNSFATWASGGFDDSALTLEDREERAEDLMSRFFVSVWIPRTEGQATSVSQTRWASEQEINILRNPPPATFTPLESYFARPTEHPPAYDSRSPEVPPDRPARRNMEQLCTMYQRTQRSGSHPYYSTEQCRILSRLPIRLSHSYEGAHRPRISRCRLPHGGGHSTYRSWRQIYKHHRLTSDHRSRPYMIRPDFDFDRAIEVARYVRQNARHEWSWNSVYDDENVVDEVESLLATGDPRDRETARHRLVKYIEPRLVCVDAEYIRSLPRDPETQMRYCALPNIADIGNTWVRSTRMDLDARAWFRKMPFTEYTTRLSNTTSPRAALRLLVELTQLFYSRDSAGQIDLPMTRAIDESIRDLWEGLERLHDQKSIELDQLDLQSLICQGIHVCKSAYNLMKPDISAYTEESRHLTTVLSGETTAIAS